MSKKFKSKASIFVVWQICLSFFFGILLTNFLYSRDFAFEPIVCLMIPKCGTHLLAKCLSLLGEPINRYDYKKCGLTETHREAVRILNRFPPPNHYRGGLDPSVVGQIPTLPARYIWRDQASGFGIYWTHFAYTRQFNDFLDRYKTKKILMIRDPRAMLVSFAHMLKKGFEPGQEIDFNLLALDLIDARKQHYIKWGVEVMQAYPIIWEKGICEYFKQFMPFYESKNCLVIKFENLVGPFGGGTESAQIEEIQKIGRFIGHFVDKEKALKIGAGLFGESGSFREGQIDGWKQNFTPEIKKAFKTVPGANKLLIDLKYEENDKW